MSASASPAERVGVLVMAHGTPATPEAIEPFYTRIRHGHPPTPELLSELRGRYEAIGGTSPLAARTDSQVAGVERALEAAAPGRFVVRYGAKHTAPFIEDAVGALVEAGVAQVVGLVLTPHRSTRGSEEYLARVRAALDDVPDAPSLVAVPSWYDAKGFSDLVGERVRAALGTLPEEAARRLVVFSAHSVPERAVQAGDPYPDQVAESAAAAAGAAGLDGDGIQWEVAWQSAGRTTERWIGPDILDVVRTFASAAPGPAGVVVSPIGFVSDHLEVLFDLDVETQGVARSVGLAYARAASLNDDPRFCELLAKVVMDAAGTRPAPDPLASDAPAR